MRSKSSINIIHIIQVVIFFWVNMISALLISGAKRKRKTPTKMWERGPVKLNPLPISWVYYGETLSTFSTLHTSLSLFQGRGKGPAELTHPAGISKKNGIIRIIIIILQKRPSGKVMELALFFTCMSAPFIKRSFKMSLLLACTATCRGVHPSWNLKEKTMCQPTSWQIR